jgi:uncharacterized phage-associated protein
MKASAMFNEKKVSQMAAFFLEKGRGAMPVLKLMKLLYLADRESMDRYDEPISGDRMVSMPHGPVLSRTLELINGECSDTSDWPHWVTGRAGYEVGLAKHGPLNRDSLGALSDADIEVLADTWNRFGKLGTFEIRDLTHTMCGEWIDPKGSMNPIPPRDVFLALGRDMRQANEAQERLAEAAVVDRLFATI